MTEPQPKHQHRPHERFTNINLSEDVGFIEGHANYVDSYTTGPKEIKIKLNSDYAFDHPERVMQIVARTPVGALI